MQPLKTLEDMSREECRAFGLEQGQRIARFMGQLRVKVALLSVGFALVYTGAGPVVADVVASIYSYGYAGLCYLPRALGYLMALRIVLVILARLGLAWCPVFIGYGRAAAQYLLNLLSSAVRALGQRLAAMRARRADAIAAAATSAAAAAADAAASELLSLVGEETAASGRIITATSSCRSRGKKGGSR